MIIKIHDQTLIVKQIEYEKVHFILSINLLVLLKNFKIINPYLNAIFATIVSGSPIEGPNLYLPYYQHDNK